MIGSATIGSSLYSMPPLADSSVPSRFASLCRQHLDQVNKDLFLSVHSVSTACAIQVLRAGDRVAVVGDGKLGLLVAQMLVLQRHSVTHFGKHEHKLQLVSGTQRELVTDQTAECHAAVSALGSCAVDGRFAQPPHSDSSRETSALTL